MYTPFQDLTNTGAISALNANLASGAPTANSTVSITGLQGVGALAVQVTASTLVGTLIAQGSVDGSNWITLKTLTNQNSLVQQDSLVSVGLGLWKIDVSGLNQVRITCSAFTSGSITVFLRVSNSGLADPLSQSRNSFGAGQSGLTPTVATNLIVIESGAIKITRLQRIIIQPGLATAAGFAIITLSRNTVAASAAGTLLASADIIKDANDPAFTGIVRVGAFTVAGVTITDTKFIFVIPIPITTGVGVSPIILDLTNNGKAKGFTIPIGVTNGAMIKHSGNAGAVNFGIIVEFTEE